MELQEGTAAKWESVIADLTSRAVTYDNEVTELTQRRDALALDAELGQDGAGRELQKLHGQITSKGNAAASVRTAIQQAKGHLEAAHKAEVDATEWQRRERITHALGQYLERVREIDTGMQVLSQRFGEAAQSLERATDLMTGPERVPFSQLPPNSMFGGTCAAGFHGLDTFIQLGPQAAGYPTFRQPLAAYVESFVTGWLKLGGASGREGSDGTEQ